MKITAIKLNNIRGFQCLPKTDLSDSINLFIGSNNSGKTTLLSSIYLLQKQVFDHSDITIGAAEGSVELYFSGHHPFMLGNISNFEKIVFHLNNGSMNYALKNGVESKSFNRFIEREPANLIYPYLSKRKVTFYETAINESNANSVSGNFSNLYSKIDRLITPQFKPGNDEYISACKNILGFEVSSLAVGSGKQAVYFIKNAEHIPLTAMGEGVANVLGLIVDLCVAEDRIFLIEEPENDIHPRALKALLELIIEKSATNQFFISTHSNIVMKYLGGAPGSKVFNVKSELKDMARPNLFVSDIKIVSDDPEERRSVLEDLGYDLFDFDLWKCWLFLEESSAEILIRDYFIEWFVKPLKNKIRTFSAGGASAVLPKFEDFDKLFIYLHLEPTYKNKVWVIIDAGEEESGIISKMKEKYVKAGWNEANFGQFDEHDFERYYPSEFQTKVGEILSIPDKQKRRKAKKELLDEIKEWISRDESSAKEKFKKSAADVIERLKQISKEINK